CGPWSHASDAPRFVVVPCTRKTMLLVFTCHTFEGNVIVSDAVSALGATIDAVVAARALCIGTRMLAAKVAIASNTRAGRRFVIRMPMLPVGCARGKGHSFL